MMMELWLMGTAVLYTYVGYRMGKSNGMQAGIDGTLKMLETMRFITITETSEGEVSIEKAVD